MDVTVRAPGAGDSVLYLSENGVANLEVREAVRLVKEYDPTWELVTMFLKKQGRVSTYRVGVPSEKKP